MRALHRVVVGVLLLALALAAAVWALNRRGEAPLPADPAPFVATTAQIEQGAYLARVGNCAGCHTARGGAAYAGGRAIETPFGSVYGSNLTPDAATGLGAWSSDHFWRALHNGRSRDGRLLYPAFPYAHTTLATRADSDALFAYLQSLPPEERANRPHALRFPYGSQAALAVWRALYFKPGEFQPEPQRGADWNRGAYLVRGLAHCGACHGERNALGAASGAGGGLLPGSHWYAPALDSAAEAGVADWSEQEVVDLLKTGQSTRGSALGPMAEVVYRSTQHLSDADLRAMAAYLRALPPVPPPAPVQHERDAAQLARGATVYTDHCAACHGDAGEGAPGLPLPLAGRRGVTMESPVNAIRMLLGGGYAPATAGHPRPLGMPPFVQDLSDADIAAVLSHLRASWGHDAAPVSALDVLRAKEGRLN